MEGKFLIHRKILTSDIWEQPAHFLKIWLWLIGNANWKERRQGGKIYHRGELLTNYEEIIRANRWKSGYRSEYLDKDEVYKVLKFLRKTGRIKTTKTTRGLWIKILKYDEYQSFLRRSYGEETEADKQKERERQKISTEAITEAIGKKHGSDNVATDQRQGNEKEGERKRNIASKRKNISFKRKDYSLVLEAYQRLKGIRLQGEEYKPVKQAIKSMFLSGRTPEQIIDCMEWFASLKEDWAKNWTINTVRKKMPEFVAGKFTKNKDWQYAP